MELLAAPANAMNTQDNAERVKKVSLLVSENRIVALPIVAFEMAGIALEDGDKTFLIHGLF